MFLIHQLGLLHRSCCLKYLHRGIGNYGSKCYGNSAINNVSCIVSIEYSKASWKLEWNQQLVNNYKRTCLSSKLFSFLWSYQKLSYTWRVIGNWSVAGYGLNLWSNLISLGSLEEQSLPPKIWNQILKGNVVKIKDGCKFHTWST